MVKTPKTTACSGMFHFIPWRVAWVATCCLMICRVHALTQVPCDAGYSGPDGGPCAPCAAGEFKETTGSAMCSFCPAEKNSMIASVSNTDCQCDAGFTALTSIVNLARACGANRDAACPATASGVHRFSGITFGNDNRWNTFFEASFGTQLKHFFRLDLQAPRKIVSIVFHNRENGRSRAIGAKIHVGSSATWQQNAVCATLNGDSTQTYDCVATGQYIFIVAASGVETLNFVEFLVFGVAETLDANGERICAPCAAGSFKDHVGYQVCSICPVGSSSLQIGSTKINNCTCSAGYTGSGGTNCTACAPGTSKAAAGDSTCIPYTCPADQFSSEVAANVAAACWECPSRALSLPESTASTACQCQAGTYEETRVLNPLYAQRSYSSLHGGNHLNSLLDDLHFATAWVAAVNENGQWMYIDAGEPMHIVGIITQGRATATTQWVRQFTVEYSLDMTSGSSVTLPGIFSATNTLKTQNLFSTPIYARYIRIIVNTWNAHISIRAAFIVKSCSSCFNTSTSPQGSVALAACGCPVGLYRYSSTIDVRALALVPGRAQLSTLANRGLSDYAATAQFSSSEGPPNSKGAVTFDRATSQYLDGGSHQFDIGINGFTAVVVIRFTMTPLNEERILDFGNGAGNNNILLWRSGATSQLNFGIWNGNSACTVTLPNVLQQNNWLTIVAMYDSISTSLELTVGESTNSFQCTARTNRNVVRTFIGRTFWSNNYISSSIAGLYAVDAILTEPEIQAIVSRINAGEDTLQTCAECGPGTYFWNEACEACPLGWTSLEGATSINDCICTTGWTSAIGNTCSPCAAGLFKNATGAHECSFCQDNSNSMPGSSLTTHCKCNSGYTEAEADTCIECSVGTYKLATGPAGCANCSANSQSPTPGVPRDRCLCNAGFTGPDSGECALCAAGRYKSIFGSAACLICPANSFSLGVATNIHDCTCNAGYTGADGGPCVICAAGSFKTATGSEACSFCPGNATSLAGSTVITSCLCNPGYTGENGGACAPCGVNTFKIATGPAECANCFANSQSPTPGVPRDRCLCNAGFTGPDSGACAPCAASRFKSVLGSATCSFCPVGSGSLEIAATNINICICNPGFTDSGMCSQCLPGKYKQGFGSGNCSDCPSNSLSSGGSTTASDCQCNDGYAGTNGGTCSQCTSGKYNSGGFMSMLLRQKPNIVSDAVDWNVATQRFDSKCGVTTCTGNTGAREAGDVASGTETGNGAGSQVAFVSGNTATRMQWGMASIPAAFTVCSVTRYSGSTRRRILGCSGNPAGNLNWLHGHWNAKAGSNFYNGDFHSNLQFSIPVIDNWVAMCGMNIANTDRSGIIVNNVVRATGRGGAGNCALGINHGETSDWQLSKVYIWNYHLSESDFTLAASSLFTTLTTDTSPQGTVCQACPLNSHSPAGSGVAEACECNAGYSGANGAVCTQCLAGTFKSTTGSEVCSICPVGSSSHEGATNINNCTCNAGFTGNTGASCTACPPGTSKTAPGSAACNTYTCPNNQFSSEIEANTAAVCWACPSRALSLPASTASTACQCQAGTYEETHVLNTPYAQRSYSSIWSGDHSNSLLDDLHLHTGWAAGVNANGQWMYIDAGEPMHIVGIITQGRATATTQWVRQFTVEYSLDSTSGSSVTLPGIFSATNTLKTPHLFSTPIYARYIRIIVNTWNVHLSMRAALIVKSCSSCFGTSASKQGSVAEAACECPAGAYKFNNTLDQRALVFVPGRAQLSTLANRGLRNYAATAQFSSSAGPPNNKGAVTFDRATSQYIDGGAHQFDIGTKGFTAVAVVMFTSAGSSESIFDMGKGANNDNILLARSGTTTQFVFSIRNGGSDCFLLSASGTVVLNTWLTIVATYDHNDMNLKMRIGGTIVTPVLCGTARTNRNVVNTLVGKSNWNNAYFSGSIAGLYAVDALLTEPEIAEVVSRMNAGEDTLQSCVACPANSVKSGAGNAFSACLACPPNSLVLEGRCKSCPIGTVLVTNQKRCVSLQTNFIVNVTDDYRAIFRSSKKTATALLTGAIARQRIDATLVYDAATGEENLWQHITNQTTRSCQDLIAVIAAIPNMKDQYMQAVRLLKRSGPCAPGFTGYDLLQDPGNAEFADSECVLLATTAEDTRRDALMVVQRRYMGRDATDQYEIYDYSAQYLTPALVRHVFGSEVYHGEQVSFCNVRDRLHSPAAFETVLSRVGLWTLPQDVDIVDAEGLVETAQIRQSVACP